MKRALYITLTIILMLALCGCSDSKKGDEPGKWNCTVTCTEGSEGSDYIITYSDEEVISQTGSLTLQNQNDVPITVHLTAGEKEDTFEVEAGGNTIFLQAKENVSYTVGIHADVPENTEIKLMIYDGEWSEPW